MHEGHRDRVKKRFRQEGLDHFSDIQALELLLFYGIPRVDTNPIAHALLDRFGSLSQVLEASPEELMKVPGVGGERGAAADADPADGQVLHGGPLQPCDNSANLGAVRGLSGAPLFRAEGGDGFHPLPGRQV